jgi:hypothetical protein
LAGLLVSALWLIAPGNVGVNWFWALGLMFAAAVISLTNFQSARKAIPKVPLPRQAGAALVLGATWPIAVFTFISSLALLPEIGPAWHKWISVPAGFFATVVSSFCTSSALWSMSKTFDPAILRALLLSGTVVVLSSSLVNVHFLNSMSPKQMLGVLICPGLTVSGAIFGYGLSKAARTQH